MAQHTLEQQHSRLADESRWVKGLLEGLAWITAIIGSFAVAFFIYQGATAPAYENGEVSFLLASSVFASSLVTFLLWKLLAIAVGSVSLKHRRWAAQPIQVQPHLQPDAGEPVRDEMLVG